MAEKLYTIAAISKKLDIPESTLRYYRDKFPEFIHYEGEGRKKRYKPESLEVFQRIAEELRLNKTAKEVAELLRAEFAVNIEVNEEPQQSTATTAQEGKRQDLQPLVEALSRVADQQQEIERLKDRIEELEEGQARKMQKLELEISEIKRGKSKRKRSFFERLFSKE